MSSDGDDHHHDRHKAALNAKQRGIDHYVAARYSEAERAFTEAIAISTRGDPSLHLYYSNRCAARMNLEKIRDALGDAKKTTELKGDFAKGWSRLGQCLHRQSVGENPADVRKLEEAKRALEKCLSIASENEEARRTLRIVEEKLNAEKERRREERGSRNSNTTSGNGPGIVSRVGDFLGAVRYQYSYGLSDNGRIAANCVVAAFLFFILRRWIGLGARRMGSSMYGNRFEHDYGDYIDDNTFTLGTFISWMVLYIAYKNGASPFTLYMLANNLGLIGNGRGRRGYGGYGGYGGGYGGYGFRRRGMFF